MIAATRRMWAVALWTVSLGATAAVLHSTADGGPPPGPGLPLGGKLGGLLNKVDPGKLIGGAKNVLDSMKDVTPMDEYEYGRAACAEIFADPRTRLYRANPVINSYVAAVGHTLAAVSNKPDLFRGWHFGVVESDEINAFAAPGGFVVVTTGCLRACRNEDQLAGVLAHEIAHVELGHPGQGIKDARMDAGVDKFGDAVGGAVLSGMSSKIPAAEALDFVGDKLAKHVQSGYEVKSEDAADVRAVDLMALAGYDPRELAAFFRVMKDPQRGMLDKLLKPANHYEPRTRTASVSARIALLERSGWAFDAEGVRLREDRFRRYVRF
jgi:predicted Zn-dependent protease